MLLGLIGSSRPRELPDQEPWRDTINAATMLGQSKTAFHQGRDRAAADSSTSGVFNQTRTTYGAELPRHQPYRQDHTMWNQLEVPKKEFTIGIFVTPSSIPTLFHLHFSRLLPVFPSPSLFFYYVPPLMLMIWTPRLG